MTISARPVEVIIEVIISEACHDFDRHAIDPHRSERSAASNRDAPHATLVSKLWSKRKPYREPGLRPQS